MSLLLCFLIISSWFQTLSCQFLFQSLTKRIGGGMHEWAAKVDEYARGFIGPPGSTLFEELGLYYIGPVDGHNIEDLICVLHEVAALDFMGPVMVHVITKEDEEQMPDQSTEISDAHEKGICHHLVDSSSNINNQGFSISCNFLSGHK